MKPTITTTEDIFNEYYKKYEDTNLHKRLSDKYAPKPYYTKYNSLKTIISISSYLFNLFSGITASSLTYFFAMELSGNWIIAAAITSSFIAILEISKRKVNSISFKGVAEILSNITSGLIIFFNYPVKLDDTITVIDKDYQIEGRVSDIGLFFVIIKTKEGEQITLPSNIFMQKKIKKNVD